jgi:hypothetical protein
LLRNKKQIIPLTRALTVAGKPAASCPRDPESRIYLPPVVPDFSPGRIGIIPALPVKVLFPIPGFLQVSI